MMRTKTRKNLTTNLRKNSKRKKTMMSLKNSTSWRS